MRDVTIIIQGPIDKISVDNITNYLKFGDVVVSCWSTHDPALNALITEAGKLGATVHQEWEDRLPYSYNTSNIYKQTVSTLNGANITKTEFCIKTRGDERYSNMQPIVDAIHRNPDKAITDNRAQRNSFLKFLPSDHILGMRTCLCRHAFGILKRRPENPTFEFNAKARGRGTSSGSR